MRMMKKFAPRLKEEKNYWFQNFDFLVKHAWLKKCITIQCEVIIVAYFLNSTNAHVKNEKLYATIGFDIIFAQTINVGKVEKEIYVQFIAIKQLSSKATQ